MIGRRDFFALLGAGATCLALAPSLSKAMGASAAFRFARYDPELDEGRDAGLRKLLLEVEKRTSVAVDPEVLEVSLEKEELFEVPFLIWSGSSAFPELSEEAVTKLRLFLDAGGFVVVDNHDPEVEGFDQSIRREITRLDLGDLEEVPEDHVIYQSFYLLDAPWGRVDQSRILEGLSIGDRLGLVYTLNDLQGAWARDGFGQAVFDVVPGGEPQRELSFRFGINCVMYALCINYKADQVHIPFILERRQWRVE